MISRSRMQAPLARLLVLITMLATLVPALIAKSPTARAASSYTITDLGTLTGNNSSFANSINNAGRVTGYSQAGTTSHAFRWESGTMTDLGTLGGTNSVGTFVNNNGHIVGLAQTANSRQHAFAEPESTMLDLGTLSGPTGPYSAANGINNNGLVVGLSKSATTSDVLAVTFDGTNVTPLPLLSGDTNGQAWAVNDAGQIVGSSGIITNSNLTTRAVQWQGSSVTLLNPLTGHTQGEARAINATGQIAGSSSSSSTDKHAVRWQGTTPTDLGLLDGTISEAYGINAAGTVVGRAAISGPAQYHAFIWTSADGMRDLNGLIPANSGWELTEARSINDSGKIVGYGTIGGQSHGFLLTPAGPAPSPSPGPSPAPGTHNLTVDTATIQPPAPITPQSCDPGYKPPDRPSVVGGTVQQSPSGTNFAAGAVVTLTAIPNSGFTFIGWSVSTTPTNQPIDIIDSAHFSPTFPLTMDTNYIVVANFGPLVSFPDVPPANGDPNSTQSRLNTAITQLVARGVIHGECDGTFGPNNVVQRGHMAGFIARALGWDGEDYISENAFPDRCDPVFGCFDNDLWKNVSAVAHHGVAKGYCDAQGQNCEFDPHGALLNIQVINFIARGMIEGKEKWERVPPPLGTGCPAYCNLPRGNTQQARDYSDILTYLQNAGVVMGHPTDQPWVEYTQVATRATFVLSLWQALEPFYESKP